LCPDCCKNRRPFLTDLFLEPRAEILKKFRWFFDPNDDIKKSF
jgi:hypothetical protein